MLESAECCVANATDNRVWDLTAATPMVLLCLFGALGFILQIDRQWPHRAGWPDEARCLSEAASALFLAVQAGFTLVRRLPLYKAPGLAPRALALTAAYFSYVLLLLPRAAPSMSASLASSVLTLAGTLGSVCTLLWLGRSFSILPQARELVTRGPYRWIRHPLYLTEIVAAAGLALQFLQPWGLLVLVVAIALQFPRMRQEELTLASRFPAYRAYAARTPRILPLVWTRSRLKGALRGVPPGS